MKQFLMLCVALLLLVLVLPVLAQDATREPDAVVTAAVTVAADAPAVIDAPTETDSAAPAAGMNPDMVFIGVVLLSLVFGLADRFAAYRLSKELARLVPPDWMPAVEMGMNTARRIVYERAGAFADSTESPFDNNLLDEEMKQAGWEFYTDAATGERHARKRPTATLTQPATSAG